MAEVVITIKLAPSQFQTLRRELQKHRENIQQEISGKSGAEHRDLIERREAVDKLIGDLG